MAARPKYSVGTKVRLLGEPVSSAPAAGEFAIISRHFLDTDEPRYRIRSLRDRHERSVGEDDISIAVQASRVEDRLGSKVVPFRTSRPGLGRS
jgi:hypothetical protein